MPWRVVDILSLTGRGLLVNTRVLLYCSSFVHHLESTEQSHLLGGWAFFAGPKVYPAALLGWMAIWKCHSCFNLVEFLDACSFRWCFCRCPSPSRLLVYKGCYVIFLFLIKAFLLIKKIKDKIQLTSKIKLKIYLLHQLGPFLNQCRGFGHFLSF